MVSFTKGWVRDMSKCPFWSTKKDKVSCYKGCPMQPAESIEDLCLFKEHLASNKIAFKEIIEDDFAYNNKDKFDYNFSF